MRESESKKDDGNEVTRHGRITKRSEREHAPRVDGEAWQVYMRVRG